jgi:hypothetical protein
VTHASRTPLPVVFKASDLELVAGKQQTRHGARWLCVAAVRSTEKRIADRI